MINYITVRVRVRGIVQGVGFRFWTVRRAEELSLVGFVRNLPDGAVEAVLSGPEELVEEMIRLMRIGPASASVEELDLLDRRPAAADLSGFTVLR
jgi:acylphosphatase